MKQKARPRADHLWRGRSNRRVFLAGSAAIGLLPATAARATFSGLNVTSNRGGADMVRQMEETATGSYLQVPGGRLYYEVSGAGPVLLLLPGGMADSGGFLPLASFLEDCYTVVRYDPRGISNSRFAGEAQDVSAEAHADDAALLLQAIGGEPAYVLGHSGGAVISLALVERHPELVQTLVAHEPPLVKMLPEGDPRRAAGPKIYNTFLKEGPDAAMEQFMGASGMEETAPPDMSPEAMAFMEQEMARMAQNLDFFFAHYLLLITGFEPDIAKLQSAPTNVLVGVGEDSVGQETYETSVALAERLGTEAVTFPGDHVGMATQPEAFAARLDTVLQAK
jgi:pimeloyl-ACP methyl ester carboxylesterase